LYCPHGAGGINDDAFRLTFGVVWRLIAPQN
jgi:hypothetical protein